MTHCIHLKNPRSIDSIDVENKITNLIMSGVKTNEISVVYEFVAPNDLLYKLSSKFRRLKNKIALNFNN